MSEKKRTLDNVGKSGPFEQPSMMEDTQPLQVGDRVRLLTNDCIDFVTIGTVGTVVQKAPHQRFPPYMWLIDFDEGEGTWNIIDDTLERIDDK